MRKQLLTTEDATPLDKQITKPCSDCPFARASVSGWLGGLTPDQTLAQAHGEARIDCHVFTGPQCAGAAIYRANMAKRPRDPELLTLPPDRETVFSTFLEFQKHHTRKLT